MDEKFKRSLLFVVIGVIIFAAFTNLTAVFQFSKEILKTFLPIIVGFVMAFILNVPMKGFENLIGRLFKNRKRRPGEKTTVIVSLILTLLCVALVVALVSTMLIPEFISSVRNVCNVIESKWPEWIGILNDHGINTENISGLMSNVNFDKFFDTLTGGAGLLIGSVANISASIATGMLTVLFAFIIAIYALTSKRTLVKQGKRFLYAFLSGAHADKICHVISVLKNTYAKFLSGQCIEAVILGFLIFVSFSIFRLPYAGLIAVLTGTFAFIPYIGAYAACVIGSVLILISNPSQVLLCIAVYLVVQFIETQFIYPRVVGKSVGLSPLWTLIATMVGGKLFGLLGIIFFIPFVAVVSELLKEAINKRLSKKDMNID